MSGPTLLVKTIHQSHGTQADTLGLVNRSNVLCPVWASPLVALLACPVPARRAWMRADSGWAAFEERPAFSGAEEPAAAVAAQPPAAASPAAGTAGHGEFRSQSPPIDIPAAAGSGRVSPPGEGEDLALSQYTSFYFWRSPPTILADDAELGDLRENLEGSLPERPAANASPRGD